MGGGARDLDTQHAVAEPEMMAAFGAGGSECSGVVQKAVWQNRK